MDRPSTPSFQLPELEQLPAILGLQNPLPRADLLTAPLLRPLGEFLSSGGKRLRAQMIELGFRSVAGEPDVEARLLLQRCNAIIEGIHAGSLIIDDIQDFSETRRGAPTLHRRYGMPIALNAGNWLYFWALDQIGELGLSAERERDLHRYFARILLRAHFGQAIDVGTPLDQLPQAEVAATCLASMELKTGALMALAFDLGAFAGGATTLPAPGSDRFARPFGVALQMHDDIGNFLSPPPKGKEDLRNARPSWVWSVASQISDEKDYQRFVDSVRKLPDESFLHAWAGLFDLVAIAGTRAAEHLAAAIEGATQAGLSAAVQERIRDLGQILEKSYG